MAASGWTDPNLQRAHQRATHDCEWKHGGRACEVGPSHGRWDEKAALRSRDTYLGSQMIPAPLGRVSHSRCMWKIGGRP